MKIMEKYIILMQCNEIAGILQLHGPYYFTNSIGKMRLRDDQGFIYQQMKPAPDGGTYWRCALNRQKLYKCPAKLKVQNDGQIRLGNEFCHNHLVSAYDRLSSNREYNWSISISSRLQWAGCFVSDGSRYPVARSARPSLSPVSEGARG